MPLEAASFISDLVATNPTGTDQKLQGDDHLRLIKNVLQTTFPNIDAEVSATPDDLNLWAGSFGTLTDNNYFRALGTDAIEQRTPAQVRNDIGADDATNLVTGTIPEARIPGSLTADYEFAGEITFTDNVRWTSGPAALIADGVNTPRAYRSNAGFPSPGGFSAAGNLVVEAGSSSTSAGFLVAAGQVGVDQSIVFGVKKDLVRVVGDGIELRIGGTDDFALYHDGSNNNIDTNTGHLIVRANSTSSLLFRDGDDVNRLQINNAVGTVVSPIDGPASSEVGFRKIVRQTTGGTLTAAMNGTCQAVSSAVTVNNSVHAAGDAIQIYNNSASAINITAGTITTMRLSGSATTGTRSLAARGLALLWFNAATEVIVSGDVT